MCRKHERSCGEGGQEHSVGQGQGVVLESASGACQDGRLQEHPEGQGLKGDGFPPSEGHDLQMGTGSTDCEGGGQQEQPESAGRKAEILGVESSGCHEGGLSPEEHS